MTVQILCHEHAKMCRDHAKTLGSEAVESLERLLTRYDDDPTKIVRVLEERMSPYSFYFTIHTVQDNGKERFWYNGGFIFWEHSNVWNIHT